MEDILAIRYGSPAAHPVHETWFKAIGVRKAVTFNYFTSLWFYKLHGLNHLIALIYSLFIPRAKIYFLTGPGCTLTAILKKKLFGSKIYSINSDTFFMDVENAKGIRKKYMLWLLKHIDGLISYIIYDEKACGKICFCSS